MRIRPIQTGAVQVHERQRRGEGRGLGRSVRTLLDRTWTKPLPIYTWLIEHPEGLIVVDTGETARTAERNYFPRWHPFYRYAVRLHVRPDQEIGPQLRALGITPEDVRHVVLTHLHTDHAGGLHHFPHSEILVSEVEFRTARGWMGKLRGYLPHQWPRWFAPRFIEFGHAPLGPFPVTYPVTRAGDVHVVPTPGHTSGHCSVVALDGDRTIFLAGDTSYSEELLRVGALDGVCAMGGGESAARDSIERVLALARTRDLVYLPSHDPDSASRLLRRHPLPLRAEPAARPAASRRHRLGAQGNRHQAAKGARGHQ